MVDILDWGGYDEYEINYYKIEGIVITEKNAIFLGSNFEDSLHKIYYNRPFGYEAPGIHFKAKLIPLSEIEKERRLILSKGFSAKRRKSRFRQFRRLSSQSSQSQDEFRKLREKSARKTGKKL